MVRDLTPFETRVYGALEEIPEGFVVTYGELAKRIDCGSAQAVGQALRRNPYAPQIPCHRVISGDRRLGGFRGGRVSADLIDKRDLLRREGVLFDADGRIAAGSLYHFV